MYTRAGIHLLIFLFIFCTVFAAASVTVSAQETPIQSNEYQVLQDPSVDEKLDTSDAILIADVNFFDVSTSNTNNILTTTFSIKSSFGDVSNISYGIIVDGSSTGIQLDSFTANESLSLVEGVLITKKIEYELPNFLSEDGTIYLVAYNERGLLLAKVKVEVVKKGVSKASCFEDKDSITCLSKENGTLKITAREDGPFGKSVQEKTISISNDVPISEKKDSFFEKINPGLYTVTFEAFGSDNKRLTEYTYQYRKNGNSARILSAVQKARVEDGKMNLDTTIFLQIQKVSTTSVFNLSIVPDNECGEAKEVPVHGNVIKITIETSCAKGFLDISVLDNEKQLDYVQIPFLVQGMEILPKEVAQPEKASFNKGLAVALLLLVIICILYFGIKFRKPSLVSVVFFIFIFGGFLFENVPQAEAAVYAISGTGDVGFLDIDICKTCYNYEQQFNANGSITVPSSVGPGSIYSVTFSSLVINWDFFATCRDTSGGTQYTCNSENVGATIYNSSGFGSTPYPLISGGGTVDLVAPISGVSDTRSIRVDSKAGFSVSCGQRCRKGGGTQISIPVVIPQPTLAASAPTINAGSMVSLSYGSQFLPPDQTLAFTTSGSFSVPSNVTKIAVKLIGGGGGGGGSKGRGGNGGGDSHSGGGGGSGGSLNLGLTVSEGQSFPYTIGTGGARAAWHMNGNGWFCLAGSTYSVIGGDGLPTIFGGTSSGGGKGAWGNGWNGGGGDDDTGVAGTGGIPNGVTGSIRHGYRNDYPADLGGNNLLVYGTGGNSNGTVPFECPTDGQSGAVIVTYTSPCTINGVAVPANSSGAVDLYPTVTTTYTLSCNGVTSPPVTVTVNNSCIDPQGGTVASGGSVTEYLNATEPYGGSCTSQSRTCTNGTLSGSYTNASCSVTPAANCISPQGATVLHGSAVTEYQSATVPFGNSCVSESRTCTNGTLSGSYTNASCSVSGQADLVSSGITAPSAAVAEATISLSATVSNTGNLAAGSFSDDFTYQYGGTSGGWIAISNVSHASGLSAGTTAIPNDSVSFNPPNAGTLYIQHCVDAYNEIAEGGNESPNCTVAGPVDVVNNPKGYLDSVSCVAKGVAGWTCDKDVNASIDVHIYNGVATAPWTNNLTVMTANTSRRADADSSCGGSTASHGFNYTLPLSVRDGAVHTIYAYGINVGPVNAATSNTQLNNPTNVSCPLPSVNQFEICDVGTHNNCKSSGETKLIGVNEPFTIYWDVSGGEVTSCGGTTYAGFSTGGATSGSDDASTATNQDSDGLKTTYSLSCYLDDTPDNILLSSNSIYVQLLPPPELTISPRMVDAPGTATVTWDLMGETRGCSLTGGLLGSSYNNLTGNGTLPLTVSSKTTYTLTCPSGSDTFTVEIRPQGFET